MSAGSFNLLAFGAQYLCTAVLVVICVLAGFHLYLLHVRKMGKPQEKAETAEAEIAPPPPPEMPKDVEKRQPTAEIETRERVTVAEAQSLIPDEVAVALIEEKEEKVLLKPKAIINIDTLSENYEANDTVTLESLKEKKLIKSSVNHVKVLARGVLNKPLTVTLPEFSVDAVKMILLTGGKAIKLKTKK